MAKLKAVQKGVFVLGGSEDTATETIDSVDLTKTILFKGGVSIADAGAQPDHTNIMVYLSNDTTITFERQQSSGVEVKISWYVVEFVEGVSVQRGKESFNQELTKTEDLDPGTDLAKSFCLISHNMEGGKFGADDFCRAQLVETDGDKKIEMAFYSGGPKGNVAWQVVEITDGANIQHGLVDLFAPDDSITENITSVDLDKSFLIFSYTAEGNVAPANGALRGFLSDSDELTFERNTSGVTARISWYVIEMTDGTTIQQKHVTLGDGITSGDTDISEVDEGQASVHIGGLQQFGKNEFNADDEFGKSMVTVDLTTLDNVHHERGQAGSAPGTWTFYVINWFKEEPTDNGGENMDCNFRGITEPRRLGTSFTENLDPSDPDFIKFLYILDVSGFSGSFISAEISKRGGGTGDTTVYVLIDTDLDPDEGDATTNPDWNKVVRYSFRKGRIAGLTQNNQYGVSVFQGGDVDVETMTIGFQVPLAFETSLGVCVEIKETGVEKIVGNVVYARNSETTGSGEEKADSGGEEP